MNEPIKHHYIPQFILKNFSDNNDGWVYYYDKKREEVSLKKTSEIFVVDNLYRDEIYNPDNPTQLEKDLAKYEQEVSNIIKKFVGSNEIHISIADEEKVKLFFAIMGMRSYGTSKVFGKNAKESEKEFYSYWQKDGNLNNFWKRNLAEAVKCRSIEDLIKAENIDEPIKAFLLRDSFGMGGLYFIIGERRGDKDFIIGDCYPGAILGGDGTGKINGIPLYMFFPLSPSRVLIVAPRGIHEAMPDIRFFKDDILRFPKLLRNGEEELVIKKLYKNEVEFINSTIRENSKIGYAFLDKSRVDLE